MNPQKIARAFGVLYLITFFTSIPAFFFYAPVLDDPRYILGGLKPHPLERFSSFGGGAHFRGHPADPSTRRSFVGHHRRMGDHHPLEDGHVPPVPDRHRGTLRQASGRGRVAWPGRLPPVEPLLVAPVGICLCRNLHLAAVGERGAATLTPAAALLPHAIQRLAAIPVGLAVAWLGYSLFSERRARAPEHAPGRGSPQLRRTAAE
jgi:hypothetical protein